MIDAPMFVMSVLYLAICGLVGYMAYKWPAINIRRNFRFLRYQEESGGQVVLEFETKDGNHRQYRGKCTVWHTVPSGLRCSVQTEGFLHEIWAAHVAASPS